MLRRFECDCARPTCRQCQKRKIECVYKLQGMRAIQQRFDDNSRETRTFLNRLLSATDEEALGIIRHLRSNPNLASAICFADSRQTSFDRAVYSKSAFQSNDHEPSMRSSQSMEPSLATMYPLSYPTLTPIDVQHASVLKHKPFGNSPTSQTGYPTSLHDNQYCDTRLNNLQISNWTTVQVSNEFAAQVLSLYLTRDHPCMPFFDSELFLDDLVNQKTRYCSSFLVNAVLCLGCVSGIKLTLLKFAELVAYSRTSKHTARVDETHKALRARSLKQPQCFGTPKERRERASSWRPASVLAWHAFFSARTR